LITIDGMKFNVNKNIPMNHVDTYAYGLALILKVIIILLCSHDSE